METIEDTPARRMQAIGQAVKSAAVRLATSSGEQRRAAIVAAAELMVAQRARILAANQEDIAAASHLAPPMVDRLRLNETRLKSLAQALRDIAEQPDPLGVIDEEWTRPNGLQFQRVRVPLGVIGMIYESRPNVTADAAALCIKSGNGVILRGGSESTHSSRAISDVMQSGLTAAGLPAAAVHYIDSTDRALVGEMLRLNDYIDVVIPRGGKGLIKRVQEEARVPVMAHLDGNCHIFVHGSADGAVAESVILNAKLRRTSVCGAAESLVFDRGAARSTMPRVIKALLAAGCEVRGDQPVQAVDSRVKPATELDWGTEYLDAIISARVVEDAAAAIAHINRYGSHHTDAIIASDPVAQEQFLREIDSAIVLVNASTQFADGGEFGFGGEIGIATGKIHARGPVGAQHLTSYKYRVRGTGQIRP
ncbi:MAG: glutamate-5-semialdehyde dehydrogenase [Alphaproteobacteria bacterium]|nr:glutamate-5-semialdehyde dehydrogenase [Alphaproteobacteria bacterium]